MDDAMKTPTRTSRFHWAGYVALIEFQRKFDASLKGGEKMTPALSDRFEKPARALWPHSETAGRRPMVGGRSQQQLIVPHNDPITNERTP